MEIGVKRSNHSIDRLSCLPTEVVIGIISFLPLRLAIITGSLSRQWRGLWTKVTSIEVGTSEFNHFPEFMTHITSPSIDRFIIKLTDPVSHIEIVPPPMDNWLQQACDRNVRQLTFEYSTYTNYYEPQLPVFIFQSQSLVSLELLYLKQFPCQVNLPNLKRLWLKRFPFNYGLLKALMKGTPSLEDLLLQFSGSHVFGRNIKIYKPTLRRLVIDTCIIENILVLLYTPKLEQFVAHTLKSVIFRFEGKPFSLLEAKIDIVTSYEHLSEDKNKAISEFYGAINNVSVLKLDVTALDNMSTVFRNVNRLAIRMKLCHNIETVLSFIDLCPLLDVLTLELWGISMEDPTLATPSRIRTCRRVLKRIEIEGGWSYQKLAQSFLKLVRFLLSGAIELEHFHLRVTPCPEYVTEESHLKLRQEEELNLCDLLCKYYNMASKEFEVEFVGMFHKYISSGQSKSSFHISNGAKDSLRFGSGL